MYKGYKSWYLLIFSILFFILNIFLYFNIQFNSVASIPIIYFILPLLLLFEYVKTSVIKVTITDGSIHFKTLFRKGNVQLNSITSANFQNSRKIEVFTDDKKIIIPLELQNSALFLKEFRAKYITKYDKPLDQNRYYAVFKKRVFKDQQNNRINLHLWKSIILSFILFYISALLTDSFTHFNIIRIILLLLLPTTTFFLPEINFAFNIEKKSNNENDILTRNHDYERKIYLKYFLFGLITLIVLIGSYLIT